jgi:hypothetical protein
VRGRRLFAFALLLPAVPAWGAKHSYVEAVVVGHNRALDPSLAPLQHADDDAARMYELLSVHVDHAALLAVLDRETQLVHPHLAARARPPTREALRAALADSARRIDAARSQGRETVLYFFFAGHGSVLAGGEGALHLQDTHFTRADLYREVLAAVRADYVHLLIDACASYHVVARRGPWKDDRAPSQAALVQQVVVAEDLERFPNAGVLVSTSGAEDVHEWSEIRGGVFSHALRAAIAGAADVNGDGRIEYSEASAFIAAAFARVADPRARVRSFARAPARDLRRPLVDLGRAQAVTRLSLPPGAVGRYIVEDDRGVRVAEIHKSAGHPVTLALPPRPRWFVQVGSREAEISAPAGRVALGDLQWRPLRLARRGSLADSYQRGLFAEPYGWGFYRGYVARSGDPAVPSLDLAILQERPARPLRTWKWVTLGAAAAAAGGAATAGLLARRSHEAFEASLARNGVADARLRDEVSARRTATNVLLGVAGAAAATSIVLWVLDVRDSRAPAATVTPAPGGATLGLAGEF